jgi:hypothetical protein
LFRLECARYIENMRTARRGEEEKRRRGEDEYLC